MKKYVLLISLLLYCFTSCAQTLDSSTLEINNAVISAAIFKHTKINMQMDSFWINGPDVAGRQCCIFDVINKKLSIFNANLFPLNTRAYISNNTQPNSNGLFVLNVDVGQPAGNIYLVIDNNGASVSKNIFVSSPIVNDGYIWGELGGYGGEKILLDKSGEIIHSINVNYHGCTPRALKESILIVCDDLEEKIDIHRTGSAYISRSFVAESSLLLISKKGMLLGNFFGVSKNQIYKWNSDASLFLTYSRYENKTYILYFSKGTWNERDINFQGKDDNEIDSKVTLLTSKLYATKKVNALTGSISFNLMHVENGRLIAEDINKILVISPEEIEACRSSETGSQTCNRLDGQGNDIPNSFMLAAKSSFETLKLFIEEASIKIRSDVSDFIIPRFWLRRGSTNLTAAFTHISENEKEFCGYKDNKDKWVIPAKFNECGEFFNRIAIVAVNGFKGVIDNYGNFLTMTQQNYSDIKIENVVVLKENAVALISLSINGEQKDALIDAANAKWLYPQTPIKLNDQLACEYIGVWSSFRDNKSYRVTLKDNAEYIFEEGSVSSKGFWAVETDAMAWYYPNMQTIPDKNKIFNKSPTYFTLQENNGTFTLFELIEPIKSTKCSPYF
jgi:hypothetical protein